MISSLIGTGIFGLLGLSVLCPLLAFPGYYFQRRTSRNKPSPAGSESSYFAALDILIPAHNEAEHIGATLSSIQRSIEHLRTTHSSPPWPNIAVHVGADSCTDNTAQIAGQFPLVSVTEFPGNRSKWITINALVASTKADWVILVDAGTVWPESFLTDFVGQIHAEPDSLAIAPSYRPLRAGWLPLILWQIESTLKKLESFCGGPVSLHGATVGYQTIRLKNALGYLGETLWLNDDVVIPLILRALYPTNVIVYPVGEIQDAGARHDLLDMGRRKRMVLGNLQWVRTLLPHCFRLNPVAGLLAVRRLFRLLWAYWLACVVMGLALAFHSLIIPGAALLGILVALSGSFRQLAGAGLASLLAPFRMTRPDWQLEGSWK